jgi:transcriptional regulator with XRE-family HTH domain
MPVSGTTVVRRQLGRRLRRLREDAGKKVADVEEAKLASAVKIWRIENGKSPVRINDVWALGRFYKADDKTIDELTKLAEGTAQKNWWENYSDVMGAGLALYIGLEESASALRIYESELVHGLFQTPEYFRAIRQAERPAPEQSAVDRSVTLRMERQRAVLGRTNPPRISAVLNAAVLAREVGGTEVMAVQAGRLRELAAADSIEIRVLPWYAGAHAAMTGSFTILDFDDPDDPAVVYADTQSGARYEEEKEQVSKYREVFTAIWEDATPIEENNNDRHPVGQGREVKRKR